MQRLLALLLDYDKNAKVLADRTDLYQEAPRAYRRAVGALRSMCQRHPWRMSVSLVKREGTPSIEGRSATLVAASCAGVFNDRGWEARIPVVEIDGEIFVEDPEGIGTLLANSSEAGSRGYVYSYPIEIRALLASVAKVILHIANDDSMNSGRTEFFRDQNGWTPVFYPSDKYEQLELLTWWFKNQEERFREESQQDRKYIAFRLSDTDEGNGMVIRGIRERELYPAPFQREVTNRAYQERAAAVEALAAMSHEEALDFIQDIPVDVAYWVYNPIRMALTFDWGYACTASASQLLTPNKDDGTKYVLTLNVCGEWQHPSYDNSVADINMTLVVKFDAQFALCENSILRETANSTKYSFVIDQETTNALLRELAVKRGIFLACERKLIPLDERNGYDVPLDERQISYEEYLRMGLEDFFNLLVGEDSSTVDPEILRGPDAANNISDDQVIDLVNLLEFKPRYGRLCPEEAYVDADVNKRIYFYPYDYGTITVGITLQEVYYPGISVGEFQHAWLSVSDGEHVSSRQLSKEACYNVFGIWPYTYRESPFHTDLLEWSDVIADYALQTAYINESEVEFTCYGQIKTFSPTLEQVNRVIQSWGEGAFPPMSAVEYDTRMKEFNEEYEYDRWHPLSQAYDDLRYIFPVESYLDRLDGDVVKCIQRLMGIEPKDSVLLAETNVIAEKHIFDRVGFLLEERQEDLREDDPAPETTILREVWQTLLDWDDTKDGQLLKLAHGGRSLAENVELLSGDVFTDNVYGSIGGVVETRTLDVPFAAEWRASEQARKGGMGLYDQDGAPLFLNVPVNIMYQSVYKAIKEDFKQARKGDMRHYFLDLKHKMLDVLPEFWRANTNDKWGTKEVLRHADQVFADTPDKINHGILRACYVPHSFFFGSIEYCLQAWDDSTQFPYSGSCYPNLYVNDVEAARRSEAALPIISGGRRVCLNRARATCVRELGEFYRMVGTDSRLEDSNMLTISQIPELVQQIGKVHDALTTFVSLAEGYWPAYTQIDGPAPADKDSDERKRLLKQRMAVARRVQASLSSYGRSSAQYSRFDSLEK